MAEHNELIELPMSVLATLALEIWRLWGTIEKMKGQPTAVTIGYSIRKMKQALENQGFSFVDLTGEIYDAGMAVDIIDTEGEVTEKVTDLIIKEMVSPIILFGDKLLTHGEVILEKKARNDNMAREDG